MTTASPTLSGRAGSYSATLTVAANRPGSSQASNGAVAWVRISHPPGGSQIGTGAEAGCGLYASACRNASRSRTWSTCMCDTITASSVRKSVSRRSSCNVPGPRSRTRRVRSACTSRPAQPMPALGLAALPPRTVRRITGPRGSAGSEGTRSVCGSSVGAACLRLLLCLLALFPMLDDASLPKEDRLQGSSPLWRPSQQELQIHAEVLELFRLRVGHDGARLGVRFHRQSLLVPADRFRLLSERGDHARKGACLGG